MTWKYILATTSHCAHEPSPDVTGVPEASAANQSKPKLKLAFISGRRQRRLTEMYKKSNHKQ